MLDVKRICSQNTENEKFADEEFDMARTLRKPEIISMARRDGRVTVEGLVGHFGVTPQTIRRDLSELADDGHLDRIHGGAVLPSSTTNIGYSDRRELNLSAKFDIAKLCAQNIPNDCSLFLNIGTTTEAVANELLNHEGLLVVTNNINVALILSENPKVDVVVTGGSLRRSDGGLIGYLAEQTIEQFRFDYGIIGCSALTHTGDILDFDIQEVRVSKTIIKHCKEVFLVADTSKFERDAPVLIGSLADIDVFFSDQPVDPMCKRVCDQNSTLIRHPGQSD
nr:DeoR/GlpR family DNA-binding transcription regulator [Ruegeria sp. 2205SS24-7]